MKKSYKYFLIYLLATVACLPLHGQAGYRDMDQTNVLARLYADGTLFWDGQNAWFQAPKGGGANTVSAAALWIGGLDQTGDLHMAAQTYRETGNDFWPGPLNKTGATDATTSTNYNKVWKVTRLQIDSFKAGLSVPSAILDWPGNGNTGLGYAQQLAPYVDVDNNGIYEPMKGDYPAIKGDAMAWWVYNDNLHAHDQSRSLPMGIEVQVSAYTFNCQEDLTLNNTLFLDYKIINRSGQNYHDVYTGLWADLDLGNLFDDYIGSIPGLNTFYAYNAADYDRDTIIKTKSGDFVYKGFQDNLPVQAVTFLRGVKDDAGKEMPMSSFMYFNNDNSKMGNPHFGAEEYNLLKGIWPDGTPLTLGGTGYGGTQTTKYAFPADLTGAGNWSELGLRTNPGDRRGLGSFGPFSFNAGETKEFTVAFSFNRSASGKTLHSYDLMKYQAGRLFDQYRSNKLTSCTGIGLCTNSCVWPGDANNDGVANVSDLWRLGLAYGQTGPARPFASAGWIAQSGTAWSGSFSDGINYRYADANGDGRVDSLDAIPLTLNFGEMHKKKDDFQSANAGDPDIRILIDQDSVKTGHPVSGSIVLGTADLPAANVLGVSFILNYDPTIIEPGSVEADVTGSDLGSLNDLILISKEIGNGKTEFGLVRTSKSGKDVKDIIIRWKYIVEGNVAGAKKIYFDITSPVAVSPNLAPISLNPIGSEVVVYSLTTGLPRPYTDLNRTIRLYPNPVQDQLTIDLGDQESAQIHIMDLQGRQLSAVQVSNNKQPKINLADFPEGMYLAEIITPAGRAIQKFCKTR